MCAELVDRFVNTSAGDRAVHRLYNLSITATVRTATAPDARTSAISPEGSRQL